MRTWPNNKLLGDICTVTAIAEQIPDSTQRLHFQMLPLAEELFLQSLSAFAALALRFGIDWV